MPVYADKRTGRLYIEFQYKGERVKHRLPIGATRSDAARLEVKLKNDILFRSHGCGPQRADVLYEHFVRDVFGPYADAHYSRDTFDKAVHIVKASKSFFSGKTMRAIKPADIERFQSARAALPTMHKQPRKPATVAREMSIISKIFSLAVKNDVIDYNPCSRITRTAFDNTQDRVLRREDEAKLFRHIHGEWTRDVCLMALNTGLRQNDILTLQRFSVDWQANQIRLLQSKTKRVVIVPMNSVVQEILKRRAEQSTSEYLFASPVTGRPSGSVRHTLARACKKAGIERLTIRDLRRTFGTRLHENGFDSVTVARSLGHSDLRSVHRYERSTEMMQTAVDSLVKRGKTRQNPTRGLTLVKKP